MCKAAMGGWARGDLNPHALNAHWHLKPACLPFHHSPVGNRRDQRLAAPQHSPAPLVEGEQAWDGHNPADMGVAKSIERRLEGLLEGFFAKVFRSGLQPVEVGRRILREMAESKTVSVNRIYAPNEFRVVMGADDYGRFSQMEAGLQREFTEFAI